MLLLFGCSKTVQSVEITGLKDIYKRESNIEFSLVNNTENDLHYIIGIECFENGHWMEIIGDISQPKVKMARVELLNGNSAIKKNILISDVFYMKNLLKFEKYRFKVWYGVSVSNMDKRCYSNSYRIE